VCRNIFLWVHEFGHWAFFFTYFAYITFASMALRFGMEEESLSFFWLMKG
jgi:hypothetical protein